ncbi:MAG: UDP-3-O-(3-hydroxymyristoyl)glucosamine N-acyltransferase [Gammaproteobacteria bacterium]
MAVTLQELATLCDAELQGGNPSQPITSVADIMNASDGQVTLLIDPRYSKHLADSSASACLIGNDFTVGDVPQSMGLLRCADPEMAFITALKALHPESRYEPRLAPQAVIEEGVDLGKAIYIGPYAVVGQNAAIGDGSEILAGAYIGRDVKIGKNCRVYPYAVIYDRVVLGDNVIIHSGAIIGADGFGYKYRSNQHVKVPQVGNVVIEDNVEIGANTCVDRGALGSTLIGRGSKIDNLVQIGHNNRIGKNVIICGHSGVSGSCTIEDGAILAGSAGIADHVTIGRGAVIMARSGVASDIPAGMQAFGSPAKDKKIAWREQAALTKLPELIKRVKELEMKLEMLKNEDLGRITDNTVRHVYVVYRVDDNGNEIEMERFHSEATAKEYADKYQAKGHKQVYLVKKADIQD